MSVFKCAHVYMTVFVCEYSAHGKAKGLPQVSVEPHLPPCLKSVSPIVLL